MLCKHIPLFALTARARDEDGGLFRLQWGQKTLQQSCRIFDVGSLLPQVTNVVFCSQTSNVAFGYE